MKSKIELFPTFCGEPEPGEVGSVGEGEGLSADELPLPATELQQLNSKSLLPIETCGCETKQTLMWDLSQAEAARSDPSFSKQLIVFDAWIKAALGNFY